MAPDPPGAEREAERRLSVRTLAIASAASAVAAIVTSRFWIAGTPFAAALTPVIVALVSELLGRPTDAIAQRMTSEDAALRRGRRASRTGAAATDPARGRGAAGAADRRRRAASGPAPPDGADAERVLAPPDGAARQGEPPIRVYGGGRRPRRRLALGVVLSTGLLAFLIAAVVLTVPELIAGGSIGKGSRDTTLFGGRDRSTRDGSTTPDETETAPQQDRTTEAPAEEPDDEATPTTPPRPRTQPTETERGATAAPRTTETSPGSPSPRRP